MKLLSFVMKITKSILKQMIKESLEQESHLEEVIDRSYTKLNELQHETEQALEILKEVEKFIEVGDYNRAARVVRQSMVYAKYIKSTLNDLFIAIVEAGNLDADSF